MASTSGYSYVHVDGPPSTVKPRKKRNAPRNTLPEPELIALRARDAQRKRARRQSMTDDERRKERERDKARKALKRRQSKAAKKSVPVRPLPGVAHILNAIPLDTGTVAAYNYIPKLPKTPPY